MEAEHQNRNILYSGTKLPIHLVENISKCYTLGGREFGGEATSVGRFIVFIPSGKVMYAVY